MSRRPLISLLAGLALAGGILAASPAQAASYGVSLELSATKADVGKRIGLTGQVSGKNAGRKTLQISYRVAAGTWKTVGTVKTSSKGAYSAKFTVRTAGDAELRVIAPRSGRVHTGTSPTRPFTGWRWLSLYDEPYYTNGFTIRGWDVGEAGTVNGGTPPRESFVLYNQDKADGIHGNIGFRADGRCDVVKTLIALPDFMDSTVYLSVSSGTTTRYTLDPGAPVNVRQDIVPGSNFSFSRTTGDGGGYPVLEKPQAHCSLNHLLAPGD